MNIGSKYIKNQKFEIKEIQFNEYVLKIFSLIYKDIQYLIQNYYKDDKIIKSIKIKIRFNYIRITLYYYKDNLILKYRLNNIKNHHPMKIKKCIFKDYSKYLSSCYDDYIEYNENGISKFKNDVDIWEYNNSNYYELKNKRICELKYNNGLLEQIKIKINQNIKTINIYYDELENIIGYNINDIFKVVIIQEDEHFKIYQFNTNEYKIYNK